MIQVVNDAYQTLIKIAPVAGKPAAPPPENIPPPAKAKPTLTAWKAEQLASARQSAPPPPPPSSSPLAPPAPPAPPAPTPQPMKPVPPPSPRSATPPPASPRSGLQAFYDGLFPPESPRRRFGPIIIAVGLVLFVLLVAKCVSKSPEQLQAAAAKHIAETTGRLIVKSNRPNTTVEVTRIPAAGETASAARNGTEGGAAEQVFSALPQGRYAVMARSTGWPEIRSEVTVETGRTAELGVKFKTGSLRLDSEPIGATVRLGDEELGKTPLTIAQLPPGENQFVLQYPSWPALPFKTTITENVEATATAHLPNGKLVVQSNPAGATIRMWGRTVGQTPQTFEHVPAGINKLNLRSKDFPALDVTVTVEDRGEAKLNIELATGLPLLDSAALLRDVWVPDNPDNLAPPFAGLNGPTQPKNGVIRNLHRKRLYETWLHKSFRFSATVKTYDRESGQIEFTELKSELSKYRVLANLSPAARSDKDLPAQLGKGATFTFYGRLDAVEESRWPAKVITFEFFEVEPLH